MNPELRESPRKVACHHVHAPLCLCYVCGTNVHCKDRAASGLQIINSGLFKVVSFLRKETILNTPLECTRRFTFATFVYRNHSKDTAARERGGQSCVPGPAPPPRVISWIRPAQKPPPRPYLPPHGSWIRPPGIPPPRELAPPRLFTDGDYHVNFCTFFCNKSSHFQHQN